MDPSCLAAAVRGAVWEGKGGSVGGGEGMPVWRPQSVWTARGLTRRPAWTPCAPRNRSVHDIISAIY